MAGRARTTKPANDTAVTETEAVVAEANPTEDVMTDTAVDTTEVVADEAAATDETVTEVSGDSAEKPAEVEKYDIAPVDSALDAALSGTDDYTAEGVFDSVMGLYETADRKGRAAITRRVNERIRESLMDPEKAKWAPGYGVILKALDEFKAPAKGTGTPGRPRKAVDPTDLFVEKIVSFQLALALLSENKPEGLAEDWEAKASASYQSEFAPANAAYQFKVSPPKVEEGAEAPTAPEVSDVAARAVKLAARTSTGSVTSGEREHHDVGKHIAEVVDGLDSGAELNATELADKSSEEYGETKPTRSAIVSWLTRESNADAISELGVTVIGQGERGKLGIRKN